MSKENKEVAGFELENGITIMAASNSLIGTYLKQISQICDQVADFINFYGFIETANALEKNDTTVELSKTFNEYGYVTLGITWLPGTHRI